MYPRAVELCWTCCPSLVVFRARGREAQKPGELYACDFFIIFFFGGVGWGQGDLNCLCRCLDTMPNVNALCLVE